MKKRIIILGSVVIAVIVLWSAAWLVLAGIVRQNIDLLAEGDGDFSLACERLNVGGYPFRFDADCAGARIASGDLVAQLPGLRASIRVYAPTHVLASALGPMQLTDNFTGSRNGLAWSGLEASLRLSDWRIARASVSATDMVWTDALFGEALIASGALVELHALDIPEQHDPERGLAALAIYGRAQDAQWPGLTLGDANAEIQLEITGVPDDIRTVAPQGLTKSWHDAGGALRVVSVHGTDADATLDAQGELQLDARGMPEGQISIRSSGIAERVGPLLAEPWRTLVLGTPGEDGSYSNLLNFRSGALFSGLVPVAPLPALF